MNIVENYLYAFENFNFYITGELIKMKERHHYSNTDKDGDKIYMFLMKLKVL